jgi:phage terminase large subunit-like protein
LKSKDLKRLKIPWKEWAEKEMLTLVDDVEISPQLITEYISEKALLYDIKAVAVDDYRYALLSKALKEIGFDKEHKNLYMVKPSDIMKVVPVIDSIFVNHFFYWDDTPLLRWATNNTKLIKSGVKTGENTGNYVYGKIEPKSRKTDPFMALVHSMCIEDELGTGESSYYDLPVIT